MKALFLRMGFLPNISFLKGCGESKSQQTKDGWDTKFNGNNLSG